MPKKIPLSSSSRHILLDDEDLVYLQSRFGPRGSQPIGVSAVIRAIVHQKVMALRTTEIEARDTAARGRPTGIAGGIAYTPVQSISIEDET